MDYAKKKVANGSPPTKRPLDVARRSAQCCHRRGCGARPGFMGELQSSITAHHSRKGNKKNTPLRSSGKEKPKNQIPRVKDSISGKSSLPHHCGLRRLSCSSSVSDVIRSDSSSSSSTRICTAGEKSSSGASDFLEWQASWPTPRIRERTNSLSRNLREYSNPLLIEGFAEMLRALERIEQEEALTQERLTAAFVVGGIGIQDQYRDWRLDIDHLSYEELLELEEKMGTVSTALSEKELTDCLEYSLFEGEDTNCSICQEEYEVEDELGKLRCGHRFHTVCIHEWLGRKNWCPVCKFSVAK